MSVTYEILCHECKVTLWIGQRANQAPLTDGYIYTKPAALQNLRSFLFSHVGHKLEFNDTEVIAADYDYQSLDDDPLAHALADT